MKKKQKFNDEEIIKLYYDIYILLGKMPRGKMLTYEEFKAHYLGTCREVI